MTSYYIDKKRCTKCGGEISWDKARRLELSTTLPINPDGSKHECQKIAENDLLDSPRATQEEIAREILQVPKPDSRTEQIQKAHDENMMASDNLCKSINGLASNMAFLNLTIDSLIPIMKTYLQSRLAQEQQNAHSYAEEPELDE